MHNGTVVTLVVNADGSYTFTAFAPLVSPTVGTTGEDLSGRDRVHGDGRRRRHGDGSADGEPVNDDTPVANNGDERRPVLDDDAHRHLFHRVTTCLRTARRANVEEVATEGMAQGALFSAGADGLQWDRPPTLL